MKCFAEMSSGNRRAARPSFNSARRFHSARSLHCHGNVVKMPAIFGFGFFAATPLSWRTPIWLRPRAYC